MLLNGKTALITGCSKGIGESIMQVFARNGCSIWACFRKESDEVENMIEAMRREYQVSIYPLYFDLNDFEQIKTAMKKVFSSKIPIDILVNNAGVTAPNSLFFMTPMETIKDVFHINFFAPMLITQYIGRMMSKHRTGSIINIASIAGIDGSPGQLEYVASKAALIGATKKLADELSSYDIRVNAIAPGITKTDMIDRMEAQLLDEHIAKSFLKRSGKPTEIADAVLFLASDMSSFMTGQTLRVDGGY